MAVGLVSRLRATRAAAAAPNNMVIGGAGTGAGSPLDPPVDPPEKLEPDDEPDELELDDDPPMPPVPLEPSELNPPVGDEKPPDEEEPPPDDP